MCFSAALQKCCTFCSENGDFFNSGCVVKDWGVPHAVVAVMAHPLSATAWRAVWQKPFTEWGPSEWEPLAGACLQPSLRLAEATAPVTLSGRLYQQTTVQLLTPLPVGGRVTDGRGVSRAPERRAPPSCGTAHGGAGGNARARRRARRVRDRAVAEARAAATEALRPPPGASEGTAGLEAAVEAAREALCLLDEALTRCGRGWDDAALRAMLPAERRDRAGKGNARMADGAGGSGEAEDAGWPEDDGFGVRSAAGDSATGSDASMGDAGGDGEEPWGPEEGDGEAGTAEEGATGAAIAVGWTEVASPSVKEEPEDF